MSDVSISKVIGGAERVLFEQAKRLVQRGHRVHILTRLLSSHQSKRYYKDGVYEWRYNVGPVNNPIRYLKKTVINGRELFENLHREYKFDCINFHQPFSALGVYRSKLTNNIAKIYTCHSLAIDEFISRNTIPSKLPRKYAFLLQCRARKFLEKRLLNRSDEIIALSQFTVEKLQDQFGLHNKAMTVIPGGVDIVRFQPTQDKKKVREQIGVCPEKIVLFTVRNLVHRMGLENLLLSMKEIVKEVSDILLVIGGEGPLKENLRKLTNSLGIEEFVKFVGFIPEKLLPDYYNLSDIFVLPTKELEGFGLVTLEAMACGIPVIGTPIGGTREILNRFDSGFLFENTDSISIAKLILKLYYNKKEFPQKWGGLIKNCRSFVEKNYSWELNIDAFERVLFTNARRVNSLTLLK